MVLSVVHVSGPVDLRMHSIRRTNSSNSRGIQRVEIYRLHDVHDLHHLVIIRPAVPHRVGARFLSAGHRRHGDVCLDLVVGKCHARLYVRAETLHHSVAPREECSSTCR